MFFCGACHNPLPGSFRSCLGATARGCFFFFFPFRGPFPPHVATLRHHHHRFLPGSIRVPFPSIYYHYLSYPPINLFFFFLGSTNPLNVLILSPGLPTCSIYSFCSPCMLFSLFDCMCITYERRAVGWLVFLSHPIDVLSTCPGYINASFYASYKILFEGTAR